MAKAKSDDKTQKERFIYKARELEADVSDEEFERAFKRVVPPKQPRTKQGADPPRQDAKQSSS